MGDSFAGVDNVFTNLAKSSIVGTETLGSGGSDHHALSTTLSVGPSANNTKQDAADAEPAKAVKDTEVDDDPKLYRHGAGHCGMLEPSTLYNFTGNSWSRHFDRITDPRSCCARCATEARCKAWMLIDWVAAVRGTRCALSDGEVAAKVPKDGIVSGLPPKTAIKAARAAM